MKWMLYFLCFYSLSYCMESGSMESDLSACSSRESFEYVNSEEAAQRIINLYFNGNRGKIHKRIGPKLAEKLNELQHEDINKIIYLRDLCDMCDHDEENPLPITRAAYITEHQQLFTLCETALGCSIHESLKDRERKIKSEERKKRYAMITTGCAACGTCLGITATIITAILAITGNTAYFAS